MQDVGVVPEMEVFDLSMIGSVNRIHAEGLASPPFSCSFCLGFENAIQPLPDHLFALRNALPPESHWGLIHEDMEDFSLLATAAGMGAAVLRMGFEDSFQYRRGRLAPSNQVLVAEILELLDKLDFEPMTPAEAWILVGYNYSNERYDIVIKQYYV
jgi:3-keto-5-aminohexanoate cleavage enzyme